MVGSHDIVFVTLDTLRHDVAVREFAAGRTPNFARLFPGGWERRHSPGSFTYSAHHAFFAGFLPTRAEPGASQERLFALAFPGSETTGPGTHVMDAPNIVAGLAAGGYTTVCIGGVGFFNQQTPLGCVLPGMFQHSVWRPELGVTNPNSTERQFEEARACIRRRPGGLPMFLFINISAIHQPNCHYVEGAAEDSVETHAAALRYVDSQLPKLLASLDRPTLLIACSDHGTLYGEDGYHGHRIGHELTYTVPYGETVLSVEELKSWKP